MDGECHDSGESGQSAGGGPWWGDAGADATLAVIDFGNVEVAADGGSSGH